MKKAYWVDRTKLRKENIKNTSEMSIQASKLGYIAI
jgi:hypothetical protein